VRLSVAQRALVLPEPAVLWVPPQPAGSSELPAQLESERVRQTRLTMQTKWLQLSSA
jgi:hypothetical protein